MTSGGQLNQMNRLPGKSLERDGNGVWQEDTFNEVGIELRSPSQGPRILFVESTHDRIKRLKLLTGETRKEKESFEVFAQEPRCRDFMTSTYGFPSILFSESWVKSNGFAGSKSIPNGHISWFRMLVKMIEGMDDYYWNEMTFFIHQPTDRNEHLTVLCFEVPDDDVNDDDHINPAKDETAKTFSKPYNFLKQLRKTLTALPPNTDLDWRCMQSLSLCQAIVVADIGVWACSKAVRSLEKSRIDSTTRMNPSFHFPQAHDLLRHALHSTEVLQVATQTLNAWLQQYLAGQKRQQRLQHAQCARLKQRQPQAGQAQADQQAQPIPFEEDTPLPPECYHDELLATFQLLSNLSLRSASNDARLRNEINLAFNVVNQQDTKAMRMISIVTLLFLPATFVSTLFSMTFFNQPSAEQPWGVSPMIWIYFVISVVMTAVNLVTWFWGARLWTSFFRNTKSKNA